MGLRRLIRKIVPREIRDNPVLAIAAVALVGPAALGAIGASTATLVGATVAANTATAIAIGTGVVTAGVTFAQTGDVSDSLKAGVLAGTGSYVGSQVSSAVTDSVSKVTGAQTGQGISAGFDASGNIVSTAGGQGFGASAAGFGINPAAGALGAGVAPTAIGVFAGNVLGKSVEAAITGRPIEQAALFGAAQSVPFALKQSVDFNKLNKTVQDVLTASAQAAVMNQDVSDAALAALVKSTNIIGKAIEQIPGGVQYLDRNPRQAKYILDTLSSALTAQLQGKDVSDVTLESLVRTTASVLSSEFANTEKSQAVAESNQKYTQAQQEEQNVARLGEQLNALQKEYAYLIDNYNRLAETLNSSVQTAQGYADAAQAHIDMLNDPSFDRIYGANAEAQRQSLIGWINFYNNFTRSENEWIASYQEQFKDAQRQLRRSGYFEKFNPLRDEYEQAVNRLNGLVAEIQDDAATLAQASSDLFTDFETELATTLAPLTAFEDVTGVGDQDLLAEIQPVAPPEDLTQLAQDDAVLRQIQEVAARPDVGVPTDATELASAEQLPIQTLPEVVVTPGGGFYRYYRSQDGSLEVISDDDENFYIVENGVRRQVSLEEADAFLKSLPQGSGTFAPDQERSLVEELMLEEMFGGDQGTTDRAGIGLGAEISPVIPGDLTGTAGGAVIGGDTGAGTAATTGTPADVGTGAEPVTPTQPAEQPSFSVLFNYLTRGGGSPYAPNKAVFDMEGGLGTAGGGSKETTFKLITINENTGEQTYDVGGKLYTLMLLPSYRKEVLVPKDPSANIVYINKDQFNQPRFVETSIEKVPFPEAEELVKQIEKSEQAGQTAGGAPAGAEGAAGGRTAEEERVATTEEQLQPGARPEEVAPGVVAEQPAPSFPELVSGITEPSVPAPVPGQAAGTQTGAQPPSAGGIGDEITDEDIIRLIEGEIGRPGGGEGEGAPGEEGAGVGEGEEGVGPGAGEEGEGEGIAGEGTGTGEGVGPGTGEGGGEIAPTPEILLPSPVITTVGRRTFQRPGEAAPYRVTGQDESGILGRKGPIFGGDEDLQRAEWNRRSLRLRRLLGL